MSVIIAWWVTFGTWGASNELSLDGGVVVILLLRRMDSSDSTSGWNKKVRGLSSDEAPASSVRDCCAIQRMFPDTMLRYSFAVTALDCACKRCPFGLRIDGARIITRGFS